jgi:hypothetical protein
VCVSTHMNGYACVCKHIKKAWKDNSGFPGFPLFYMSMFSIFFMLHKLFYTKRKINKKLNNNAQRKIYENSQF